VAAVLCRSLARVDRKVVSSSRPRNITDDDLQHPESVFPYKTRSSYGVEGRKNLLKMVSGRCLGRKEAEPSKTLWEVGSIREFVSSTNFLTDTVEWSLPEKIPNTSPSHLARGWVNAGKDMKWSTGGCSPGSVSMGGIIWGPVASRRTRDPSTNLGWQTGSTVPSVIETGADWWGGGGTQRQSSTVDVWQVA